MGGNLFKLGRIPREEYLDIEHEIRAYLHQKWEGYYRIPRYYAQKPDFGDLDIIFSRASCTNGWEETRKEIMADWGLGYQKLPGMSFQLCTAIFR